MYATSGSASGYVDVHYCPDDSWAEGGITWNDKLLYNATRSDRISPRFLTGWENPWDVTLDVRRNYALGDRRITLVLVSGGAWARYNSREGYNKPQLVIEYLTAPCYRLSVESADEKGRFPNLGSIDIAGTHLSLPGVVLAKPGAYPLHYVGDYQFVRWETEGSVDVANSGVESTTVNVRGPGRIRAVGMSAGVVLSSAQEPGVTSNLGYIILGDNRHFLPKDIPIIKPGQYQISYEGGYRFVRWEVSGDVTVSEIGLRTTSVTIRAGGGTIRAVGNADVMEYAYDDGECGSYSYKSEDPGKMWAVGFTPLFSGKLLKARFYVTKDSNSFKVHVMDKNKNDLVSAVVRTPTSEGWFDVDLSDKEVRVKMGEDFYIGIEWITKDKPKIGYDTDEPDDERSWSWNGTSWSKYSYVYDLMIRAVVETVMMESQIACSLDPSRVTYLGETRILGSISPSDPETARATVLLQYSSDGVSWLNITSVQCVASGYSYSWRTRIPTGSYQVRAVWLGSENYFSSDSSSQQLQVVKARIALTCAFEDQTVTTDTRTRVSGRVSPVLKDTLVILTFTFPSGYSYNQTVWTSSDGSFGTGFTPSEEGTHKVQAYWQGDENHTEAKSEVSEVKVVAPFPYALLVVIIVVLGGGLVVVFVLLRRRSSRPQRELPPPPTAMCTGAGTNVRRSD